ncbi:MAG: UbiA family prenyltransferase [Alkalilacustris sp.]
MRQPETLVVDLDGTLVRTDTLHEGFWAAFGRDWRTPFAALAALARGRAALKQRLAAAVPPPESLPYDPEVIAYVERWRARGGRTALVTAADGRLAEAVAGHLGLFDEAHGSDGVCNLKGPRKAAFLRDRFAGGYAYMGDSGADLPVWQGARRAITVNAPAGLRRRAAAVAPTVEHLGRPDRPIGPYLRAMRPHQWLKNLLIFVPLLAAHQFDGATWLKALLAFVSFSLIASAVYVVNDLLDLAADRDHPRKRLRPLASGCLPLAHGTMMAVGLGLAGIAVALTLGWVFVLVMLGYLAMTTAYSLHLKRRAVIDICVLAGLYTGRLVAGGVATGIVLSVWLLAFSIFFFFALAAVKRQAELVDSARRGKLQASGRGYHVEDLPVISMMAIGAGYLSVLVMALYLNSPAVEDLYDTPGALWGICCVLLYWISRMILIAHRGQMDDDPVVFSVRDRISRICLGLVVIFGVSAAVL